MALAREVINLARRDAEKNSAKRGLVGKLAVVKEEMLIVDIGILVERVEARALEGAGAADDAVNFVSFLKKTQPFSQVGKPALHGRPRGGTPHGARGTRALPG
jgi:hypothetical protein